MAESGKRHLVVFDALDRTGPDWKSIRELTKGLLRVCLPTLAGAAEVWPIPRALRQDEELQEAVLCDLATRYMGTNHRRGRTYTWLPSHLADARGQVSPRSFLLAIRDAQRETLERGHATVLHWDSIKRGVQGASAVRVQELGEDYPWVQKVLEPLQGLAVPCSDEDIEQRWRSAGTVRAIERGGANAPSRQRPGNVQDRDDERFYLPPHALDLAATDHPEQALTQELQRIGVIRRVDDERVDIPDLFRVAAKIGRRGGVRPIR